MYTMCVYEVLTTGLRDANVRGLRWQNVDFAQRLAWVCSNEAKGGELITVPIERRRD